MRRGAGIGLAGVLAVGLAVLLPAAPAAACSCVEPAPVTEATVADYDVVLTGEVTRNEADADMQRRELEVAVDAVFRGEATADQLVVTHAQSSACGTDPAVGTQVLFLMTRGPSSPVDEFAEPDELVVISCGGARAATEAAALGEGRPPDQVAAPDPATGEGDAQEPDDQSIVPWIVGGAVLGALLAAALVVARARTRREP